MRSRFNIDKSTVGVCDNCQVGKTYNNEKCENCSMVLCEPCFQFVGCCPQERIIDARTKKLRVPSIYNMKTGKLREHPNRFTENVST